MIFENRTFMILVLQITNEGLLWKKEKRRKNVYYGITLFFNYCVFIWLRVKAYTGIVLDLVR